jgi:hypothetical protein
VSTVKDNSPQDNPQKPDKKKPYPNDSDNQPSPSPEDAEEKIIPCTTGSFDACNPISDEDPPELYIDFRNLVEALEPRWTLPPEDTEFSLACNQVDEAELYMGADIRIRQSWFIKGMTRGDISANLSLAPGERLTFRLQRSQRTSLDTSTVESKEAVRNYESTISDKEVMEVARAVTKNEGWSVNASAGVRTGAYHADVSVGYQSSVQRAVNSSLQRCSDSTKKGVNQLKALNKIEVSESSEASFSNERIREITNPYRKYALNLVIYELLKAYCVEHKLDEILPVLILNVPKFTFSRKFVVDNGAFLTSELLDRLLASELQESLQYATRQTDLEDNNQRVDWLVERAMLHLFSDLNIMGFGDPSYDNPDLSFDASRSDSGWAGARSQTLETVFLLLNSYRYLIDPVISGEGGSSLRRDLVLALAKELKPAWDEVDDSYKRIIYSNEPFIPIPPPYPSPPVPKTAVFRRIPAFLSIVDQMIRPLLEGGDEDAQDGGYERLDLVLSRVVSHLNCFEDYYTERFHEYLFSISKGSAHRALARKAVSESFSLTMTERRQFLNDFDYDKLFLDQTRLIVPYGGDDPSSILRLAFPDDDLDIDPSPIQLEVKLPADGAEIVPVRSLCGPLEDVPDPLPKIVLGTVHIDSSGMPVENDG